MDQDWGRFTPLVEGLDVEAVRRPGGRPRDPLVDAHPAGNPCVAVFGPGPVGARCASCTHLWGREMSRTYWKCDLRPDTAGPGTDHRVRWPACARYEAREGPPAVAFVRS